MIYSILEFHVFYLCIVAIHLLFCLWVPLLLLYEIVPKLPDKKEYKRDIIYSTISAVLGSGTFLYIVFLLFKYNSYY